MLDKIIQDVLNTELSIEQEFNLALFKKEVENITLDAAKSNLILAYEKLMLLDNMNKKYAKHIITGDCGKY